MPTFGFSAFLKLLSLNPRPQRREVRVRLSPSDGGYDFHRSLRLRTNRLLVDREDLLSLIQEASALGNPAERRSLEAGLRQLDAWNEATGGEVLEAASAIYSSPAREFKVSFVPDFGYRIAGQQVAVHVWNTGTVDLSERMTYAALTLAASAYDSENKPADFAVLSLPDKRLFRLSEVGDQSRLAGIVAANIDQLFESVRTELKASISPPGIEQPSSLGDDQ